MIAFEFLVHVLEQEWNFCPVVEESARRREFLCHGNEIVIGTPFSNAMALVHKWV